MKDSLTNKVYFSSYFTEKDTGCRKAVEAVLDANNIPYSTIYGTKDIWARDYMPVQVDEHKFVSFRYDPDYLKGLDEFRTETVKCDAFNGAEIEECDLVLDGGNIVVCGDRMILTEKVFKANADRAQPEITKELERAFGKQVIWIPCDPHEIRECEERGELPLCHADGVLSAIDDDTVLLANYIDYDPDYRERLLERLRPYFRIKELSFGPKRSENSWIYINYLRVGDVVLVPILGELADDMAIEQLKEYLGTEKVYGYRLTV